MKTLFYILTTLVFLFFASSCNSEKRCQCTTFLADGTTIVQEPYTINVGECSDTNSNLEGVRIDCKEL